MTEENGLMETIVKILAKYPTLKEVPAGEWNRIGAIINQFPKEACHKAYDAGFEKHQTMQIGYCFEDWWREYTFNPINHK